MFIFITIDVWGLRGLARSSTAGSKLSSVLHNHNVAPMMQLSSSRRYDTSIRNQEFHFKTYFSTVIVYSSVHTVIQFREVMKVI